jgi:hypothetical protein
VWTHQGLGSSLSSSGPLLLPVGGSNIRARDEVLA